MVTMAMAMQTMKLLMTQTTLAVSFRHMARSTGLTSMAWERGEMGRR